MKPRSVFWSSLLSFTGVYLFWWIGQTGRDLSRLHPHKVSIPSGWWLFVPGANLWWISRWADGVELATDHRAPWWALLLTFPFSVGWVQARINAELRALPQVPEARLLPG